MSDPLTSPTVKTLLQTHCSKFKQAIDPIQESICMSELLYDLDRLPEVAKRAFDQLKLPSSHLHFKDIRQRLESRSNPEECNKKLFTPLKLLLSKWDQNSLDSISE